MLKVEYQEVSHFPSFHLSGSLDALGTGIFDKEVIPLTTNHPYAILDLEELTFLSSAGIRSLVGLEKQLLKRGGHLWLCRASSQVHQVLEISGLLNQFHMASNPEEAGRLIISATEKELGYKMVTLADRQYELHRWEKKDSGLLGWKATSGAPEDLLHVSIHDLGIGLGTGALAGNRETAAAVAGPVLVMPGLTLCHDGQENTPVDFLFTSEHALHGIYLTQYLGTTAQPNIRAELMSKEGIPFEVLVDDILSFSTEWLTYQPPVTGMAGFLEFAGPHTGKKEIYLYMTWIIPSGKLSSIPEFSAINVQGKDWKKINEMLVIQRYMLLEGIEKIPLGRELKEALEHLKNQDQVDFTMIPLPGLSVTSATLWLFFPGKYQILTDQQLQIDAEPSFGLHDDWELITRRIYHDASRIILQPLHGGYSAKTFMVESYDKSGRKRLPTVLKLGSEALIGREERRYRENVQPFILNNSVSVLGAQYYMGTGGICYNFLGIGGTGSTIRWLTQVYKERSSEELIPLFDRIFKNVLKPWYGQPKWEKMFLFKDHSPLFPFFPGVIEDAERILGIRADEQWIDCPWLNRRVLNPYWYLKYEFSRREQEAFLYYSSVCHGDLNMQNILIDEKDNIYIIDFSETQTKNIVSDFARLEPILKIEMTRLNDEDDLAQKLRFEEALVKIDHLAQRPEFVYDGDDPEVGKAFTMICKLREYARQVTLFEEDPLPYWLAVLEWTLPYASYGSVPVMVKRHAAFSAALICERLMTS